MDLSGPKKHKSYNNGPCAQRDRIHSENHISYWIFAVSNRKIQVKSPNSFWIFQAQLLQRESPTKLSRTVGRSENMEGQLIPLRFLKEKVSSKILVIGWWRLPCCRALLENTSDPEVGQIFKIQTGKPDIFPPGCRTFNTFKIEKKSKFYFHFFFIFFCYLYGLGNFDAKFMSRDLILWELVVKMIHQICTCPANLSVRSCLVKKLSRALPPCISSSDGPVRGKLSSMSKGETDKVF